MLGGYGQSTLFSATFWSGIQTVMGVAGVAAPFGEELEPDAGDGHFLAVLHRMIDGDKCPLAQRDRESPLAVGPSFGRNALKY